MDNQEKKEPAPQNVVTGIIYSDNRKEVLLAKRAKDRPHEGKWEFIGGKVEEGESIEDAVKREIWEEAFLRVEPVGRLGEAVFTLPVGSKINVIFLECESKSDLGKILGNLKVQSQLKWFKIEDLPKVDWVGPNGEFAKWLVDFEKSRMNLS